MQISEPMTLATDYLLTLVTTVLAIRLWRAGRSTGERAVRFWSAAFFASALAALAGGSVHGFAPWLQGTLAQVMLWKVTVFSAGAAGLCLALAASQICLTGLPRRLLMGLVAAKFLVYIVWMIGHDDFRYVIYEYAPNLLLVLALMTKNWLGRRDPAAPWIVGGIVVAVAAAGVQAARIAPHPRFNHNDLYHVIQLLAFWLLYRGGLLLRSR